MFSMISLVLFSCQVLFRSPLDAQPQKDLRTIEHHDGSIVELEPYLRTTSLEERKEAIKTLGRMQSPSSRGVFKELLMENDPETLDQLIEAISLNPHVNDLKVHLLSTITEPKHRSLLLLSLGKYGRQSHLDFLLPYLGKSPWLGDSSEVVAAAQGIGLLAQRQVTISNPTITLLFSHLSSPKRSVRRASAFALQQISTHQPLPLQPQVLEQTYREPDHLTRVRLIKVASLWDVPQSIKKQWSKESHPIVQLELLRLGHLSPQQYIHSPDPHLQRAAILEIVATEESPWELLATVVEQGSTLSAYEEYTLGRGKDYFLSFEILQNLTQAGKTWPSEQFLSSDFPLPIQALATQCIEDPERLLEIIDNGAYSELRQAAMKRYLQQHKDTAQPKDFLSHPDTNIAILAAEELVVSPTNTAEKTLWDLLNQQKDPRLNERLLNALAALEQTNKARVPKSTVATNLQSWLSHPEIRYRRTAQKIANIRNIEYPQVSGDPHWLVAEDVQRLQQAVIHTSLGRIVLELYPQTAPLTVSNFSQLAESGHYDNMYVHRVVPGFVIQTGQQDREDPGWSIPDELSMIPVGQGTVGMALQGNDTGGSQFFITLSEQPHLQASYPIFGQVIKGQWIVNTLQPWHKISSIEIQRSTLR